MTNLTAVTALMAGALLLPAKQPHPTVFVGRPGAVDGYAKGDTTPVMSLSGPDVSPWGVATAPDRLYSVFQGDYHHGQPGSVTALPYVNGSPKPIAVIRCGLQGAWSAAVDSSGNLHVTDPQAQSVVTFSPTADGCATPLSILQGSHTRLGAATGIAIDFNGRVITSSGPGNTLSVFPAGAAGDAAPIATIEGAHSGLAEPEGVAVDAADNIYATNYAAASVTEYGPAAKGDARPVRTIAGPRTLLHTPIGIAVSARNGEIYVADFSASAGGAVLVFGKNARGDVAPLQILRSSGATSVAVK